MTFKKGYNFERVVLDSCQAMPPQFDFVPGPQLSRQHSYVLVEASHRNALIHFIPEAADQPALTDKVFYDYWAYPPPLQRKRVVRTSEALSVWMGLDNSQSLSSLLTSLMGENRRLVRFVLTFIALIPSQLFLAAASDSATDAVDLGTIVA